MNKSILWLIVVVVVAGAAFWYFLPEREKPQAPAPQAEPVIRHPIEEVRPAIELAPEQPLPVLNESDEPMREALAKLFDRKLENFLNLERFIHRVVATVDNLPRDYLSPRLMPVKPVAGLPVTSGRGEGLSLSPKNSARYGRYVRLAEAVPTAALVAVYVRYYPLFQQQYEQLGYPGLYFNDRLVEVVDHLLAAPEVEGPVLLTQPRVLYQFADPRLEALSAGQKIMVRMGNDNAAKLKAKLREIRSELVAKPPPKG